MTRIPRYLLAFEALGLPQVFTDVVVVGSGVAGQTAALAAASTGVRVLVLTKDGPLESNTLYAQGGVAVALGEDDSTRLHGDDTLAAGDGLCDEAVVRGIVDEGPERVAEVARLGVRFDVDADTGRLRLGREGGHSVHRIVHSRGDATGAELQRALGAAVEGAPGTRVVGGCFAVDLLTDDGACVGVLAFYRGEPRIVWASSVVLASGGAARLFRESTNPSVTTGDGLAMAYRAGAELRDMEFMQFHPTVLYVPGAPRRLLSEAARGLGALVRDQRGARFLREYDPRGELAPRDVVSRAMVDHILRNGDTHALLDLTSVPADRLRERLPGVVETGRMVGIDVTREPLPVRPAAHYTLGGVACDAEGATALPGLWAAGEVSASGLHGANRLASNSLLEGLVVGRRAGAAAARRAREIGRTEARDLGSAGPGPAGGELDVDDITRSVASLVWRSAGVRRNASDLADARADLNRWNRLALTRAMPTAAGMEAQNLCLLASLLVEAAELRRETRGVHWREDCPGRDDARYLGHVAQRIGEEARLVPLGSGPQGEAE